MIFETTLKAIPMFSALFSFLGGSVFRAVWGEVATWVSKSQEHKQEIEAMRLQGELDDKRHSREMERLKVSADLNIRQIEVQSDADIEKIDAENFGIAINTLHTKTGNMFIDAWNGAIRPLAATTAILIWWFCLYTQSFVLTEWDKELVGVILGFYFAHRVFANQHK